MAETTIEILESDAPQVDPVVAATDALKEKFPEITDDSRQNYTGLMVPADKLLEVAQALRDEIGFDGAGDDTGTRDECCTRENRGRSEGCGSLWARTGRAGE